MSLINPERDIKNPLFIRLFIVLAFLLVPFFVIYYAFKDGILGFIDGASSVIDKRGFVYLWKIFKRGSWNV